MVIVLFAAAFHATENVLSEVIMTKEERIKKSEEIRKRMNESCKKTFNVDHDMNPFFTGKPSFYYDMAEWLEEGSIVDVISGEK